ncbi:MAG: DUF2007 domain-containing protein [Clostridia bacterium]|nr:DUF2007 domain-containing protein [Clostridia bacterium]
MFGLEHTTADEGLALLATLYDDILVAMYEELLKEENIPYLKKDRGTGSAMRIMMGQSFYGTDIYVPEALLERALELITPADSAELEENEDAQESEE